MARAVALLVLCVGLGLIWFGGPDLGPIGPWKHLPVPRADLGTMLLLGITGLSAAILIGRDSQR